MKPVAYLMRALPGGVPDRILRTCEVRGGAKRPPPRGELFEEARGAEILVVTYLDRIDEALLAGLPAVRRLCSYGVGVNHLDLDACRKRLLAVSNTPDVVTNATADLTMALLLAAARRVAEGDRLIRAGGWREATPEFFLGTEVTGKVLGIVGFGRIGQAVARRASGFSLRVLYSGRRDVPFPGAQRVGLDELLRESDFVSLHCPLTDETKDLLSRDRIARMKRGAILVNTSRGQVVDEQALAEALEQGHLAAAGLDVFRDEPNVPERLRKLESIVFTPHVGSGTVETRIGMAQMVWEEVERAAAGLAPIHPVP